MSLFYGYEAKNDEILRRTKRHLEGDPKLSISGGKMSGDIDMNYWALKNIAAPVDDFDAISKKVLEQIYLSNYLNTNSFNVVFDLNVTKAYDAGDVTFNGTRLQLIRNGQSILPQSRNSMRPEIGNSASGRYLDSIRGGVKFAMHYYTPRAQYINIHYFVAGVKLARVNNDWDVLASHDSGSHSRFMGYNGGSDKSISFGGTYPRAEKVVSIPGGTNLFTKHIISVHWQLNRVYAKFNGVDMTPSHEADIRANGSAYGTIFATWRPGSYGYKGHSNVQFYGMKIVAGYLTDAEITNMCNDMKTEYGI